MGERCTCRDEMNDPFASPCAAEFHHWQAVLEDMPKARIVWAEDSLGDQDDTCHCRACKP